METAPLILAHTHARNAAQETKRANPVAASEEHDLAAAEFAAAAQSTTDYEALRILNLLEQHHKRLGQILKSTHSKPIKSETNITSDTVAASVSVQAQANLGRATSPETTIHPPRLTKTSRSTARDLSSSIASNLASARGIPSTRPKRTAPVSPLVSNQHADGTFAQDHGYSKTTKRGSESGREAQGNSRPSWAPPLDVGSNTESIKGGNHDATASDAPFQQFYSTFESLISKISAPLAFAGLPLTSTQQQNDPSPKLLSGPSSPVKSSKKPQLKGQPLEASVDYSQMISRAALRAVRNESSNPSESFMIVPTSGHTASYAEIMNRVERGHHRDTSHGSNDDFVDAASQFLPENDRHTISSAHRGKQGGEPKYQGKTMEELALENKTLKHMSDIISKRLHAFEMSAQTSSAALAQSIRTLHLSPITTPENSRGKSAGPAGDESRGGNTEAARMTRRIEELEEVLKKYDRKLQKREDENAKLKDTLGKYKEKWDSLKAGAKARREASGRTTSGGGGGGGGLMATGETPSKSNDAGSGIERGQVSKGKEKDKDRSSTGEG